MPKSRPAARQGGDGAAPCSPGSPLLPKHLRSIWCSKAVPVTQRAGLFYIYISFKPLFALKVGLPDQKIS